LYSFLCPSTLFPTLNFCTVQIQQPWQHLLPLKTFWICCARHPHAISLTPTGAQAGKVITEWPSHLALKTAPRVMGSRESAAAAGERRKAAENRTGRKEQIQPRVFRQKRGAKTSKRRKIQILGTVGSRGAREGTEKPECEPGQR